MKVDVRDKGLIPGWGKSLEEEMAAHSSILAWRIPWTEEPGGLQSMGSERVGHEWITNTSKECYRKSRFQSKAFKLTKESVCFAWGSLVVFSSPSCLFFFLGHVFIFSFLFLIYIMKIQPKPSHYIFVSGNQIEWLPGFCCIFKWCFLKERNTKGDPGEMIWWGS